MPKKKTTKKKTTKKAAPARDRDEERLYCAVTNILRCIEAKALVTQLGSSNVAALRNASEPLHSKYADKIDWANSKILERI